MKYRISKIAYEEVEGEPFAIPGLAEFEFFKREVPRFDKSRFSYVVITEVTSGYQIGTEYCSTESAREDILGRIQKHGTDAFRKMVADRKMPEVSHEFP